jgi:hypothetical protein
MHYSATAVTTKEAVLLDDGNLPTVHRVTGRAYNKMNTGRNVGAQI